jgi:hypothetical protein
MILLDFKSVVHKFVGKRGTTHAYPAHLKSSGLLFPRMTLLQPLHTLQKNPPLLPSTSSPTSPADLPIPSQPRPRWLRQLSLHIPLHALPNSLHILHFPALLLQLNLLLALPHKVARTTPTRSCDRQLLSFRMPRCADLWFRGCGDRGGVGGLGESAVFLEFGGLKP